MDRLRHWTMAALAILALAAAPAAGQGPGHGWMEDPDGQGYGLIGMATLDLGALNDALGAQGFGAVPEEMLSLGGGGHTLLGRWLLGAEGFFFMPRESETQSGPWTARVTGGGGVLNVGYAVIRSGGTSVYPMLGLGAGGWQIDFSQEVSLSFDDVAADPARFSQLNQVSFLVQPAVGVEHFIPLVERDGLMGGLVLGLRAGYTFAPWSSAWYMDTNELSGGPDQGPEGAFVRVLIGGGARKLDTAGSH